MANTTMITFKLNSDGMVNVKPEIEVTSSYGNGSYTFEMTELEFNKYLNEHDLEVTNDIIWDSEDAYEFGSILDVEVVVELSNVISIDFKNKPKNPRSNKYNFTEVMQLNKQKSRKQKADRNSRNSRTIRINRLFK